MSNTPDPNSLDGAKEVFDYVAPIAAIEMLLPTVTFAGSCLQLSRIVYENQGNPMAIVQVGLRWLRIGENYMAASNRLSDHVAGLGEDKWSGEDRDGFDSHASKVEAQLMTLSLFAFAVGAGIVAIGVMLAVVVTVMAAFATALFALAVSYWSVKFIPVVGEAASEAIKGAAMAVAPVAVTWLTALSKVVSTMGKGVAALLKSGMQISWTALTLEGNWIDPLKVALPAAASFGEGFLQSLLVSHFAPGGGRHSKFGWENLFAAQQGVFNVQLADDDENATWYNKFKEATGMNPVNLDFVPDKAEPDFLKPEPAPEWS